MDEKAQNGQTYGIGYVMWRLANSKKPLTAKEIAEDIEISRQGVYKSLKRAYRRGWLVRRKREYDTRFENPYEWAIAERESDAH